MCFYGTCATQLEYPNTSDDAKYDPLRGEPSLTRHAPGEEHQVRERMNLQLLAQAFNLTNRANYGNNFGTGVSPTLPILRTSAIRKASSPGQHYHSARVWVNGRALHVLTDVQPKQAINAGLTQRVGPVFL